MYLTKSIMVLFSFRVISTQAQNASAQSGTGSLLIFNGNGPIIPVPTTDCYKLSEEINTHSILAEEASCKIFLDDSCQGVSQLAPENQQIPVSPPMAVKSVLCRADIPPTPGPMPPEYGQCYYMKNMRYEELGTGGAGDWYHFNDPDPGIPLQFCKEHGSCGTGFIEEGRSTWYLYDTRGYGQSQGPNWVGELGPGAPWLLALPPNYTPNQLTQFYASRIMCDQSHSECVISMRLEHHEANRNGLKFYADPHLQGIELTAENPYETIDVMFEKTRCLEHSTEA